MVFALIYTIGLLLVGCGVAVGFLFLIYWACGNAPDDKRIGMNDNVDMFNRQEERIAELEAEVERLNSRIAELEADAEPPTCEYCGGLIVSCIEADEYEGYCSAECCRKAWREKP